MSLTSHLVACGTGWRISDVVCTAGPRDRPFEERHDSVCIAAVTEGTFQYRSAHGRSVLAPGALLLGNCGWDFECGHEHGTGDRCLAFQYAPEVWEEIIAAVPGARRTSFGVPSLSSLSLLRSLAAAETAREEDDGEALAELALHLAGSVAAVVAATAATARQPSRNDERRISEAVRRIDAQADAPHALADLARHAGMSRYHFLRVFRQVVGTTPHQYLLRTRLHRAAVRLRRTDESISGIAFDAGFNDLSTFNRRFRRVIGVSPGAWRSMSQRSLQPLTPRR